MHQRLVRREIADGRDPALTLALVEFGSVAGGLVFFLLSPLATHRVQQPFD